MQINSTTPSVQQTQQVPSQTQSTPVKRHHHGHHHKKTEDTTQTTDAATQTDVAEISPQGLDALKQKTPAVGVDTTTTGNKSSAERLLDNYNK